MHTCVRGVEGLGGVPPGLVAAPNRCVALRCVALLLAQCPTRFPRVRLAAAGTRPADRRHLSPRSAHGVPECRRGLRCSQLCRREGAESRILWGCLLLARGPVSVAKHCDVGGITPRSLRTSVQAGVGATQRRSQAKKHSTRCGAFVAFLLQRLFASLESDPERSLNATDQAKKTLPYGLCLAPFFWRLMSCLH